LLKEAVRKDMKDQDSPTVFWDYCIERRARIHNLIAKANFKLHGSNPYTMALGEEETSPTSVDLAGMNGVTSENTLLPFPTNRMPWEACLGRKGEKVLRCANGC
jgi:hypothetical protein